LLATLLRTSSSLTLLCTALRRSALLRAAGLLLRALQGATQVAEFRQQVLRSRRGLAAVLAGLGSRKPRRLGQVLLQGLQGVGDQAVAGERRGAATPVDLDRAARNARRRLVLVELAGRGAHARRRIGCLARALLARGLHLHLQGFQCRLQFALAFGELLRLFEVEIAAAGERRSQGLFRAPLVAQHLVGAARQ